MTSFKPYPLKFKPLFLEKMWGGQRLHTVLYKNLPENLKIGESWEIFDRNGDSSLIVNGDYTGRHLHELLAEFSSDVLGYRSDSRFPLLIKFIDASQVLSIQVHPDDAFAQKMGEPNGKTEAWLVLDSAKDGSIICGLKPGVSLSDLSKALSDNKLESVLENYRVKRGDTFLIKAGTVHAIGAGVVLLEIQQNSDTTYRVYDWNRLGLDSQPRPLHIDQALQAIDWTIDRETIRPKKSKLEFDFGERELLVNCPFFSVESFALGGAAEMPRAWGHFEILITIDGEGLIHTDDSEPLPFSIGETILIPAILPSYQITTASCRLIRVY